MSATSASGGVSMVVLQVRFVVAIERQPAGDLRFEIGALHFADGDGGKAIVAAARQHRRRQRLSFVQFDRGAQLFERAGRKHAEVLQLDTRNAHGLPLGHRDGQREGASFVLQVDMKERTSASG